MLHSCMDYWRTHSLHPVHRTSPLCPKGSHNDNHLHPQAHMHHQTGKDLSHSQNQRIHSSCHSSLYDTHRSVLSHAHCTLLHSDMESCHRNSPSSRSGAPWSHAYSYTHSCSQAAHSPTSLVMSKDLTDTRWCPPHNVDPQNLVGSGIQTHQHGQCRSHCYDMLQAHNRPHWFHTVCPTFLCNRNKLCQLPKYCTEEEQKLTRVTMQTKYRCTASKPEGLNPIIFLHDHCSFTALILIPPKKHTTNATWLTSAT
jgi:hypothetical protein